MCHEKIKIQLAHKPPLYMQSLCKLLIQNNGSYHCHCISTGILQIDCLCFPDENESKHELIRTTYN